MDPSETLIQALAAMSLGNKEEAVDHLSNLSEWIAKDGFIPDRVADDAFAGIVRAKAERNSRFKL